MTGQPDDPTTTGHGYPVLKSKFIPGDHFQRDGWIVLAHVKRSYHPYVTWWMDTEGNCQGGHYFMTEAEAAADFEGRA